MTSEQAIYSHGHHKSVLSIHSRRTAKDSAAFLLPHIKPTDRILDLGCGPATITCDFASYVPQGSILGIDIAGIIPTAEALAKQRNIENVSFQVGDANNLALDAESFDIVFCHQLLQHVKDPVGVLKEMKRVCKKGGIVAAREADYGNFMWNPRPKELDHWAQIYQDVAKGNGGEPNAGRYIESWARKAGFSDVSVSWSSWCFTGEKAVEWAQSWSGRTVNSDFAKSAFRQGLATEDELQTISQAWIRWSEGVEQNYSIFVVGNGEVLCHK